MTEQERFEQEAEKHFIAENLTGSAFLKDRFGEYMHPQINWGWHCWQAAQQKEGYVLVPVELPESIKHKIYDKHMMGFPASQASCHRLLDLLHGAMIEAAQGSE